mmetsp:Transcript_48500/g.120217  ORF Transcript_48500/g.120217 Transcript_48500/m.120217 type:complete len:270 (+) Transcript_48500:429-1238(+)
MKRTLQVPVRQNTFSRGNWVRFRRDLSDFGQQLLEPLALVVERLAALDALEIDAAHLVSVVFIHRADAPFPFASLLDSELHRLLNEQDVLIVGGSSASEVSGLLHQHLLRADQCTKTVREVFPWVDQVELHVTECIPHNLLALTLHFRNNVVHARALRDENVHVVIPLEHLLQSSGLLLQVDGDLRDVHAVHIKPVLRKACASKAIPHIVASRKRRPRGRKRRQPVLTNGWQQWPFCELLAIGPRSGSSEPATVTTHDLVDDHLQRVWV